jgi:hypothetical protein
MKRFNENFLNKLKSNVEANQLKYQHKDTLVGGFEDSIDPGLLEIYNNISLKIQESNNEKLDSENAKILYKGLSHLTLAEVADEKLWAFMTHVTHWEYMRKRWPVEGTSGDKRNFILTRYFFKERPFSRNGLARLWWFGYITHNKKFEDEFYLTSIMLENEDQDIARIILETPTICRNKKMVEATLISLNELKQNYQIKSRDYIRHAARYINLTGSVTLWDFLNEKELRNIIDDMKRNWETSHELQLTL